jgi:competence protein ComEC
MQGAFKRPLIPVLLALIGGILSSETIAAQHLEGPLLLVLLASFAICLFLSIFSTFRTLTITFLFFISGLVFGVKTHDPSKILKIAENRKNTIIEGTVIRAPKYSGHRCRFDLRAEALFVENKFIPVNEDIRISVYNHTPVLSVGEKIRFPGRVKPFRNFNNPGRFDYERAMRVKGYKCAASISDGRTIVPMGAGKLPFPRGFIEWLQRPVRNFIVETLAPEDASFFRALILGERQAITIEQREPYNKTGLGHVLAVSGLHIGLLAWAAFLVLRSLFSLSYTLMLAIDTRKIAAFLACFLVIWYTCLAGFQISTQRAMVMVLAFLLSLVLGRENEAWSTLAAAALIILSLDPLCLFSISFQLSFCAVIGLLWLIPPLLKKLSVPKEGEGRNKPVFVRVYLYFVGLIAVSLCATIFLLPITSFYFHRISLVAVPANVTVIPLLGLWVIPSGLLSAILLPISHTLAELALNFSSWGLHLINRIIHFWADLTWSYTWIFKPNIFEMSLFYGAIICVFFFKRSFWVKAGLGIISALIIADTGYWLYHVKYNPHLRVRFFDVGQGNAALLEFPFGKKMLIDGGGFPGSDFDVGRMVIGPSLWHSKIRTINYIVLSHPQSDHMKGLHFIAEAFNPEEFWYNGQQVETRAFRELMGVVDSKNLAKMDPGDLSGEKWINGVCLELLHPSNKACDHLYFPKDPNNSSLVLRISHGGASFLFPGDIEREAEQILISRIGKGMQSAILLCPHHGSRTSCTKGFLRMVNPNACIISSGKGNRFHFPHEQVLSRLKEIDCRILRTDQEGAVDCIAGNSSIEINTYLSGSIR